MFDMATEIEGISHISTTSLEIQHGDQFRAFASTSLYGLHQIANSLVVMIFVSSDVP